MYCCQLEGRAGKGDAADAMEYQCLYRKFVHHVK
jgi:hypothetical protein